MTQPDYSDILQNIKDDAPAWDVLERVFKRDNNKALADNAGMSLTSHIVFFKRNKCEMFASAIEHTTRTLQEHW